MQKNSLYNTSSISLFQYLFAIAVILVHSGRLTSYEPVHFGLKSILGRLAVPFFIVCASFFLKQSLRDAPRKLQKMSRIKTIFFILLFIFIATKIQSFFLFSAKNSNFYAKFPYDE